MKRLLSILLFTFLLILNVRAQNLKDTVSKEDKLLALSMIWKEADYNFVFFDHQPKLDWDSLYRSYIPTILAAKNTFEYYNVLSDFVGKLKDGHTSVFVNQSFWDQIDSPPIKYVQVSGRRYITAVDTSLNAKVDIGVEIIKINGKPWTEFTPEGAWFGFNNTPVKLTLLDKKGEKEVMVWRNGNQLFRARQLKWFPEQISTALPKFEYKSLSPTLAYVGISTFADSIVVSEFKKALKDIRMHKKLILDIRSNEGGDDENAIQIAKYITDKPFLVGSMWKARTNHSAKRAWATSNKRRGGTDSLAKYLNRNSWQIYPSDTIQISSAQQRLNMPVYILTSRHTVSAAEDFLIYLMGSKNITTIGQPTAGSSGQPEIFSIPKNFSVRICSKRDALPDGTDYINIGIKPDIMVAPDGKPQKTKIQDEVLAKAIALANR